MRSAFAFASLSQQYDYANGSRVPFPFAAQHHSPFEMEHTESNSEFLRMKYYVKHDEKNEKAHRCSFHCHKTFISGMFLLVFR